MNHFLSFFLPVFLHYLAFAILALCMSRHRKQFLLSEPTPRLVVSLRLFSLVLWGANFYCCRQLWPAGEALVAFIGLSGLAAALLVATLSYCSNFVVAKVKKRA